MKKYIIPSCIAALVMLIAVSLCLTLFHSLSDQSDDEIIKPKETANNCKETELLQQSAAHTTETSTATDAPEMIQTAEVIVRDVVDEVVLNIDDEEILIYGKQITYDGDKLKVWNKDYREGMLVYTGTFIIEGNALYEKPLCITPSNQNRIANYYYNTELIQMYVFISDTRDECDMACESICFDADTGITLKGFSGMFGLNIIPIRGGTVTFAYGQDLGVSGIVDQPTDITLTWEDQSLIVSSDGDIHNFTATGYRYEKPPASKKYKVTYTLEGETRYEPTIEVIDE